ncbi:LPS export ABC transporter periplasmic protein LptC [Polaribacter glomeratus]|uniref:LPS export ABC transporter periplasmic protein LptC n=1 Tax=Polaribacter glomeratus TaxID=102 RepID=A0A2S7WJ72_9FLAO|nr:LPS export ABC transporter periplasmic protein LptC [Polaribacter glomeratus]PQJ77655.1 LPS export ABC transporter periplasmic protein LptC [Polaribacter glomeratus]TXD66080.1 LPS export ABC transporter periplasmic protein LptC [Polaribacter glomeratus]
MRNYKKIISKSIAVTFVTAMLFSCDNNTQKVRDFLADKNLPVGTAKDAYHVYKDSGRITSKLITPLLLDFSNRKEHPYSEFPKGIKIINFEKNGRDSITITGNYAISYPKTTISELKGNVVVVNHTEKSRLETAQLFWDETTEYFVSEKAFKLMTEKDTVFGVGFESKEDLSKHLAKKTTGKLETSEE